MLCLGAQVPGELDLYLDWHDGLGVLATAPVPAAALDPQSVFGAATAAVLGTAALFRLVHGQKVRPTRFNPIELAAGVDGKSQHRMPLAGAVRNWVHVGPARRGAGPAPALVRMAQMVLGAIR